VTGRIEEKHATCANRPQSRLSYCQVYAVTAFLLHIDDLLDEQAVLDAKTGPRIRMSNREGFNPIWPAGR